MKKQKLGQHRGRQLAAEGKAKAGSSLVRFIGAHYIIASMLRLWEAQIGKLQIHFLPASLTSLQSEVARGPSEVA